MPQQDVIAALDLGSNSFHMLIVRVSDGAVVERIKEMVRLGDGLQKNGRISKAVQRRAFACLERFAERVKTMEEGAVMAVGTNTLRRAVNGEQLLYKAEKILGHPISIVAGYEEARLIYSGVLRSLYTDGKHRLVIDIGGGSTEFIIGDHLEPKRLESLQLGCVSYTKRFFVDGAITEKAWNKAMTAAELELLNIRKAYISYGWQEVIGSSGTNKSLAAITQKLGLDDFGVTQKALDHLKQLSLAAGHVNNLDLEGLSADRHPVFIGGLVVLSACFKSLGIKRMEVSDGALREGLIAERLGLLGGGVDVRQQTVKQLQKQYNVSLSQAETVKLTVLSMAEQVAQDWQLKDQHIKLLGYAAELFELGLAISHSQYHMHSAYIVEHADMAGFSRAEQHWLDILLLNHRGGLKAWQLKHVPKGSKKRLARMVVLLRVAVTIQRSQEGLQPDISVLGKKTKLRLTLQQSLADERPLLMADLASAEETLKGYRCGLQVKLLKA